MTPTKQPAHAELERHNRRLAKAREALRRAEDRERVCVSAIETARDAVREAADLGADTSEATAALDQAKANSEQAVLAREGVERRVKRAAAEREHFLSENGERLLDEMAPTALGWSRNSVPAPVVVLFGLAGGGG